MDNNYIQKNEVDLIELIEKIWFRKNLIFKVVGTLILLALIISYSIPKEYTTQVRLAPETVDASANNNLSGLAAMAGINFNTNSSPDALSLDIYPDIISSLPFLSELITFQVTPYNSVQNLTLYEYLDEYQKKAWFNIIFDFPLRILRSIRNQHEISPEIMMNKEDSSFIYILSRRQEKIYESLSKRIYVNIDKKTNIITVSVQMQDPLVSAQVITIVMQKLQDYITTYRTQKAVQDYEFTQEVFDEAQQNYYKAQLAYASFEDANKHIISANHRTEQERLKNEMTLAYNVYNTLAQKLEQDKLKVQERTPVYTVLEPARLPLRASSPKKMMIFVGFVFIGIVGSIGWILFEDFFNGLKMKEEKEVIVEEK